MQFKTLQAELDAFLEKPSLIDMLMLDFTYSS